MGKYGNHMALTNIYIYIYTMGFNLIYWDFMGYNQPIDGDLTDFTITI